MFNTIRLTLLGTMVNLRVRSNKTIFSYRQSELQVVIVNIIYLYYLLVFFYQFL